MKLALASSILALQALKTLGDAHGISSILQRMDWWSGNPLAAERPKVPDNGRYLLIDYDSGGLNNIRIGWEMAAIAASESNRTLVWPPQQKLYLLNAEPSGIEYFLNMKQFTSGVNAIPLSEYLNRIVAKGESIPKSLMEWSSSPDGLSKDAAFPRADWVRYRNSTYLAVGSKDEQVCDIQTYRSSHDVLYQDPDSGSRIFTCGNWPNVGEPRFADGMPHGWMTPDWAFALMKRHFVWHPDAFHIASHVINDLGIFNYVSLHARYGDFQFKEEKTPENTLLKNGWLSLPGSAASLLQISEEVNSIDFGLPPSVQMEGHESEKLQEQVPSFLQLMSSNSLSGYMRREKKNTGKKDVAAHARGQHAAGIVRKWLGKERVVYVATDQTSETYFAPFHKAGLRTVRWTDLMSQAKVGQGPLAEVIKQYSPERLSNLAGVVESLICAYGKVFIGSEKSTFSGNIERMRLYAGAPTHATTNIEYDGPKRLSKGERLFHGEDIDPAIEAAVEEKLQAWDAGQAEVSEIGELPRPRAIYPF